MPFAAFGKLPLLVVVAIIFSLSFIDGSQISNAILELFLIGRIPGTDVVISFSAFFGGMIVTIWALITYTATAKAIRYLHNLIDIAAAKAKQIEEIAL